MKLTLTLILLMLVMGACSVRNEPSSTPIPGWHTDLSVVIIDSCQYIRTPSYGPYSTYTHKGNCNNPIHHQ